ncbi:MAG: hypothetical protein IH889_01005 [Planctomycetes bacterium]|nr:hypothetical protein [Planctomycetota bacterium]
MATLCERTEDDGFDRRDYSLQAWDAQARPEGLFSYWKAAVPLPDAGRRVFVDDDVLWDLFERLADDPRRRRIAYRFIIALILMRKKRLRYIGRTGQGENERWLMLPKGAEPNQQPIEVVNPRLGDEDVRELSEQLREVLRGEL